MAIDFTTTYAAITKSEKQEDGTLLVYGKATDDSIDSDNQICDMTWLEKAMPEWFKTGGNIREQHSNIAAGVAKELDSKADGFYINAHVVDAQSVKKVEAGVLKGFSIGIRAPRVVRDNKAVNGRIIDGQIVEVSLVDRPANPNAKLMLAKSDGGEVVQVEELVEQELPVAEVTETPAEVIAEETPAVEIAEEVPAVDEKANAIALAKEIVGDVVKFDKGLYEAARKALAQLIIVEANEMVTEGSDERSSLTNLLGAIQCLEQWYAGEEMEGEVPSETETESIEMADAPDADLCMCKCDKCMESKGCDLEMCKCGKDASAKSAEKCLECGCDKPADSHGRSDVSTAVMVTPDETPKSSEPSSDVSLSDDDITAVIERAVKSAKESVIEEITLIKSAKEAVENKVAELETELVAAKALAVSGGPKRPGATKVSADKALSMAALYRDKAAATTDQLLSKGYKEIADDFAAKALTPAE
jgi:hypothetical protein